MQDTTLGQFFWLEFRVVLLQGWLPYKGKRIQSPLIIQFFKRRIRVIKLQGPKTKYHWIEYLHATLMSLDSWTCWKKCLSSNETGSKKRKSRTKKKTKESMALDQKFGISGSGDQNPFHKQKFIFFDFMILLINFLKFSYFYFLTTILKV